MSESYSTTKYSIDKAISEIELNLIPFSKLKGLRKEYEDLCEKARKLQFKQSRLAKGLLEYIQQKMDELHKEITEQSSKEEVLKLQMHEKMTELEKLEDPTEFIQEQAEKLVEDFSAYVEKHSMEIGLDFERTYWIRNTNHSNWHLYHSRGTHISILDISNATTVAEMSNDFYCNKKLVESGNKYTEWFINYINAFESKIMELLKSKNKFSNTFRVEISSKDTFKLVLI